jgi:hypothetical protein
LANGSELRGAATSTAERIASPFRVGSLTIDPGRYDFEEGTIQFTGDRSAVVSGGAQFTAGGFWTGRQATASGNVRVRFNAHLAVGATLSRSDIDLPQGTFVGNLAGFRVDWSLTPRSFLNAFVQYNGETDTWLSNVRFNVIHRPLSDIYIVWNETRLPTVTQRALLLKYTHLLAF